MELGIGQEIGALEQPQFFINGKSLFLNDIVSGHYPIEKHEDGVYTRFLYDAELEIPRELERRMRLSDKVLLGMDWYVQGVQGKLPK